MTTLAEQLLNDDLPASLVLLEFHHPDLVSPLRLVNDTQDIVSNGNTYQRLRFSARRPSQQEGQQPTAIVDIGRVDTLVDVIDRTNGAEGATVRLMEVSRAEPDDIKFEFGGLQVVGISATHERISLRLGLPNTLNRPAVTQRFEPKTSPGLFF